ncbi:MAG: hypothetical protein WC764_03605 [Candidatus Paceibacterota bacterium]|jgi:hypothetical protein
MKAINLPDYCVFTVVGDASTTYQRVPGVLGKNPGDESIPATIFFEGLRGQIILIPADAEARVCNTGPKPRPRVRFEPDDSISST